MSAKVELWSVFAAGFTPMAALGLALYVDRKRRRDREKPPQKERLLRPPGHTLAVDLEHLQDRFFDGLLVAFGLAGIAGLGAVLLGQLFAVLSWHWLTGVAATATAMLVACAAWKTIQVFKITTEVRNRRLGLRGEQATAEALHELGPVGFRSFHDVVLPYQDWNIDHVAVGTQGVFLIETKARRRHAVGPGKPDHKASYDGKALCYPGGGFDTAPIEQADRNARSLAAHLTKKTGEPVDVVPVVVMPGWFVEVKVRDCRVRVMNAKGLVKVLGVQRKGVVDEAQVRRIIRPGRSLS
jgi:hypothetical protein